MRKKIIFILLLMFLSINTVLAVGSVKISGNTTTYVGSSVKVTIKFNNVAGHFKITSSNSSILSGGADHWYDDETVTLYFAAKKEGSATITVSPIGNIADYDTDKYYTGGSRSLTVRVLKKNTQPSVDVNKTYSKNNYLKSLSINGYDLEPEFKKDTLEYTVELEPGTEMIKISASAEDDNANVKGTGKREVSVGANTLKVVVTAENGNERTYTIKANIEEKDPIDIKIDNISYRVVKKRELLGSKDGYTNTTVNIKNQTIPALYNDVTLVTLVGLKNPEGKIKLFSYDTKTGEFSKYREFKFDVMSLYIIDNNDTKYEKINIDINGEATKAFKIKGLEDYYLLYGINTLTGYQGYYLYDIKENSIQRYDTTLLNNLKKDKDKYLSLVTVLSSVCFLTMLFLLIEVNRDNKREREE